MSIIKENIPCWYELSFLTEEEALSLRISEEYLRKRPLILENNMMVIGMKQQLGFEKFDNSFYGDNFGFDESFINAGIKNGFVDLKAVLPVVRKKEDRPCGYCKGTGKNELFADENCIICKGEGISYFYDWQKAFALSATFTLLFTYLYPQRKPIDSTTSRHQLITVCTITQKKADGGSLFGEFSKAIVSWMKSIGCEESFLNSLKMVTTKAYGKMYGCKLDKIEVFDAYDFKMMIKNGRLIMDCPGDACGLHPSEDYGGEKEETGYKFSCHNVDSPMQQLTLLAGLAALHDEARRAGVGVF